MFEYSVVATTYNDEREILQYLENICKQTNLPCEIVVADGGSKDNTLSIIDDYSKQSPVPIRRITKGRLNIAEGYNEAIEAAHSDFIGLTGVGNSYEADYFEKLIDEQQTGNYDIVYSPIRGRITTSFSMKYCETVLGGDKGQILPIASNHGALIKKNVFIESGYFYTHFVYAGEDAEFYELARSKGYSQKLVHDAVVRWFVPETKKEYLKQIRNYTIANMQLWSNLRLIKQVVKRILPIIALLSVVVLAGLFFNWTLGVIIGLLTAITGVVVSLHSTGNYLIRLLSKYMPVYYIITNFKYASSKYKVHR